MIKGLFFKIVFIFLLLVFFNNKVFAENKIVYLNLNYILNNSIAGKVLNEEISKQQKSNSLIFEKNEKKLKNEQDSIIKQKNILKDDEYNKRIENLKVEFELYKKNRKKKFDELNNKIIKSKNSFMESLQITLSEYAKDNDISLVMQKKNILLGKTELDITKDFINIFNEKIKIIELK
tara:strand:- start:642 stop:1175 length:534 start_codon:yes stop_codon:yes gene_type:complete